MKRKKFLPILLTISLLCLSAESGIHGKSTNAASVPADSAEGSLSDSENPFGTASPEGSSSQTPEETPVPSQTPAPAETTNPAGTPKPTKTPKPVILLKKVTNVKIKRYSTTAAKITWKKVKKAKYYRVYVSRKKNSGYQLKGITQKTHFLAKKLKNNKKYYFYIKACKKKKKSATDSNPSKKVQIKTKTFSRKIVFAGDSITTGIAYYTKIPIDGKVKIVAVRGLNTSSFCSKRAFGGKTGLQKTISLKPYRAYLMLGMNGVIFMRLSNLVEEYRNIIQRIKAESPGTDVVICAVSPVTKSLCQSRHGFRKIPKLNKMLKKLAKSTGSHFFDYTGFMKDSSGCLQSRYAAGDGYHWQPSTYRIFARKVKKYEKSLDD